MTKEEAIALAESSFWEPLSARERAEVQLNERLLCMPFDVFHKAVEDSLGRPVWTHEFVCMERLRDEFYGSRERPTMQDIMNLIPEDKRIVVSL